ncbi:hypothetical protein BGZ80_000322 [Entomortierella chlamydospora]|uniref:Translation initiation factor 3 N-terminal domain-containing protein n=1 Tax=Entomortierella chlamydospora TaxID=101097 RepID=A0A9P6MSD7_9FUNG|nr:hypothetical protein BGZ79_009043 [Entomortierella chlamydospora]KAG0011936.1 hypothetical protein BGZ80_000322 [Entomortierella chlamydospora]
MIPIRCAAFTLSRARTSAQFASYTTRSNGAAFLNNLDFLAPAPSQPRPVQQTKPNSLQSQQPPQSSNKTSTPPLAVSLADLEDLDDLDVKSPPKRVNKFASVEAKDSKDNKDNKDDEDKGPSLDRLRRDEEIRSLWIQYITPEGNQGQKRLAHVLKSFDRSQYYLIEVNPSADPPVCKLFSKKVLYKKAKEAKQAKKASALTTKELQLHWGTDAHDLDHKLSKFRGFLEKGHRLEIQINGRRGKNTTAAERDAIMERVRAEFEPVSKYVRKMEWITPTSVTMLLQGVPQKVEKTKEV